MLEFLPKWEIILEFHSNSQNSQPGELSDPLLSLLCFVSDGPGADLGDADHLSLLSQLPSSLWAKSPTDIGKIHSTLPIKT